MIINSILDQDFYCLTMGQVILHQFPNTFVKYKFYNRSGVKFTKTQIARIKYEISGLTVLSFIDDEYDYLKKLPYFKLDYLNYLKRFEFNPDLVHIDFDEETGKMDLTIEGLWIETILFEVPVLAIINQVYFENEEEVEDQCFRNEIAITRAEQKAELINEYNTIRNPIINPFILFEFGTRRRFSFGVQKMVVETLKKEIPFNLRGTSNVYFAKLYGLTPIGTMAHQFISGMQSLIREEDSQKAAFENWIKEYRGDLGIALSDTLGLDKFFKDFDLYFAKLFDGIRQDSGDPVEWGERIIEHYKKLKINPLTKKLVFSDSLNIPKAIELHKKFNDRIQTFFGIGTNLSNDVGYDPINIVIKMVECDGKPVAKLSSNISKTVCEDKDYLENLIRRIK